MTLAKHDRDMDINISVMFDFFRATLQPFKTEEDTDLM